MKKISSGLWYYKRCLIYESIRHPKLYGKYELFEKDNFIDRTNTLDEARNRINKYLHKNQNHDKNRQ